MLRKSVDMTFLGRPVAVVALRKIEFIFLHGLTFLLGGKGAIYHRHDFLFNGSGIVDSIVGNFV